jgi:ketosteroid isomerase-like protein
MTSKEVVQTMYDCFTTGDMEKFASMYHEDAIIKVNGMHTFRALMRALLLGCQFYLLFLLCLIISQ